MGLITYMRTDGLHSHFRTFRNFWESSSLYLSHDSYMKYRSKISNTRSTFGIRISTRTYGGQLRVPRNMSVPWNCCIRFSITCDIKPTVPSHDSTVKRLYSRSSKTSTRKAAADGKIRRTIIADGDTNANKHSLLELFCETQQVRSPAHTPNTDCGINSLDGSTTSSSKMVDANAAISGKKANVKGRQKKFDGDQEDIVAEKANSSDKNVSEGVTETRGNKKHKRNIGDKKAKSSEKKVLEGVARTRDSKKQQQEIGDKKSQFSEINVPEGVAGTKGNKKQHKKLDTIPAVPVDVKSSISLLSNGGATARELAPLWPPSGKSVMVVESSSKARTIQKYLGDLFDVIPSYGHIRDLAARSGSVRPDDDFSMVWEVPVSAWAHLKTIKVALRGAQNLILATDPDREGEAISWHLIEMLQQQDSLSENINVARVVFYEITETAIKDALMSPRELDINLTNAYLARRALDYLIGFSVSPLLWRKLPGCQSAGRVQSAALSLLCDKEMEIDQFKPQEYWSVAAEFCKSDVSPTNNVATITSQLSCLNSKRLDQLSITNGADAESIKKRLISGQFSVLTCNKSKTRKNPPMPYITSTLQQDSASTLHFAAAYTMKLAQKLYEGVVLSDNESSGLITYMRTDGLHVSAAAAADIHTMVKERYGNDFAPTNIRTYFKKVKNAQEAHEAIRPTCIRRLPSSLVGILDDDSLKLYALIWMRTLACQMEASQMELIQVEIGNAERDMVLRASASKINFLGHQIVYKDPEAEYVRQASSQEKECNGTFDLVSSLKAGEQLLLKSVKLDQHHTKPPARFSESSLIKKLEDLGIGRPSTYAQILKVLQDREYVTKRSGVLYPEFRGRMVSSFMSEYFEEVSDCKFTADMENELDNVSAGVTEWKGLLKDYWSRFKKYCDLASNVHVRQLEKILEKKFEHILFSSMPSLQRVCPSCSVGTLIFKVSRVGSGYFIGCDQHPKCKYIAQTVLSETIGDDLDEMPVIPDNCPKPKLLGHHPASNEKVFLKKGPFGYYVQLGDDRKECPPKRVSLSDIKVVDSFTLEGALDLLRYPIILGNHPEDNHPVLLQHSKYGFSIRHKRTIAPLPKSNDPKEVTLEIGLKLLSGNTAKHGGRHVKKAAP